MSLLLQIACTTDEARGPHPSTDVAAANGVALVRAEWTGDRFYLEGYRACAELRTPTQEAVTTLRLHPGSVIQAPVPAGDYEVLSYVMPNEADGSIGHRRAGQCHSAVRIISGEPSHLPIELSAGEPCRFVAVTPVTASPRLRARDVPASKRPRRWRASGSSALMSAAIQFPTPDRPRGSFANDNGSRRSISFGVVDRYFDPPPPS